MAGQTLSGHFRSRDPHTGDGARVHTSHASTRVGHQVDSMVEEAASEPSAGAPSSTGILTACGQALSWQCAELAGAAHREAGEGRECRADDQPCSSLTPHIPSQTDAAGLSLGPGHSGQHDGRAGCIT